MQTFIVQYLTTNRHGGLEDRETTVRGRTERMAADVFMTKHPGAVITWIELAQAAA